MLRTREEIREIAAGIVNLAMGDVLFDFPTVAKAIDRLKSPQWAEAIESAVKDVEEILLDKFGYSD